jgi:putative glutamine amidotransferase
MRAPVIGICTALEQARWGVWDQPALLLPRNYIDTIQRAGAVALMLPPDPRVTADPDLVLDLLDGLVLAGGADVDPQAYGAERAPQTVHTVPERDEFELALTRRAIERDIPFLGICRGMQVLNVAQGGTLIQDLPTALGHTDHCRVPGSFEGADHPVHLAAGSQAAKAAGGEDLVVTGWSDIDDLPEAIEARDRRFALGVQWHPEADLTSQVIATLVEEAREFALARTG